MAGDEDRQHFKDSFIISTARDGSEHAQVLRGSRNKALEKR